MSEIILSCTTCALRNPPLDEVSETFKHAPKAGYTYWGLAGPITWTPGLIRWLDTEGLQRQAAEVGLERTDGGLRVSDFYRLRRGSRKFNQRFIAQRSSSRQTKVSAACVFGRKTAGRRFETHARWSR